MAACSPVASSPALPHLVFVYGTLKRHFTNYERYLGLAVERGGAVFLGHAQTKEALPLVVRPPTPGPKTRGPVLLHSPGVGHRISGEVFMVDSLTLEALDILEGVKQGRYFRHELPVEANRGQTAFKCQEMTCASYLFPPNEDLLSLEPVPEYCYELHSTYDPSPVNQKILDLCCADRSPKPGRTLSLPEGYPSTEDLQSEIDPAEQMDDASPMKEYIIESYTSDGAATQGSSHSLCAGPSPMEVYCIRLLPGDDIVQSLCAFAKSHHIEAAVVLTCVGSTAQTTLRPAGVPTPKVFDGKYEIVSMTGTLSVHGHHLHMSVSDHEFVVRGGHMMKGCIVRTTAEIALGLIQGVEFTRPKDPRTEYDELSLGEAEQSSVLGVGVLKRMRP